MAHLLFLEKNYDTLNVIERKLAVDKLRNLRDILQELESELPGQNTITK